MPARAQAWHPLSRILVTAVVILAVRIPGGAVRFWDGVAKDRVIPKRCVAVEGHNVYRSGQLSKCLVRRTLAKHGIKIIVALTGDDPQDKDQEAKERAAAEPGIELRRFPLGSDGTGEVNQGTGDLYSRNFPNHFDEEPWCNDSVAFCLSLASVQGAFLHCCRLLKDG